MNKEIRKIINVANIHPISYEKKGKIYIISDKKKTYVIKLNTNNSDIYKYLLSRDFLFFPEMLSLKNSNYDMYEYIPEIKEDKEQKIEDLIVIIAKLHNKTSYLREIDLDEIKSIYESIKKEIDKTKDFYIKINDLIDKEVFLSPPEYLLIRNISLIYYALNLANNYIDDWYRTIINEKSIRVSLLHNNISIEHLIINEDKYLISWDKAYFDNPIYDIEGIYRKYYASIEFANALRIYEKNNKLNCLEYKLLVARLLIPKIIYFSSNTLQDTEEINEEISFLNKIVTFIKKDKIREEEKLSKN